jgi:hypothetical protein
MTFRWVGWDLRSRGSEATPYPLAITSGIQTRLRHWSCHGLALVSTLYCVNIHIISIKYNCIISLIIYYYIIYYDIQVGGMGPKVPGGAKRPLTPWQSPAAFKPGSAIGLAWDPLPRRPPLMVPIQYYKIFIFTA